MHVHMMALNQLKNQHYKNMNNQEKTEIANNYESAMGQLKDKGFTLGESFSIRKAFTQWGAQFDNSIQLHHLSSTYISTRIKNYGFTTEKEAKFANALLDLAPEANPEKLLQVMGIVTKLLDVESDYTFISK